MYALLARLFGMMIDLFYRRRRLGAQIPRSGPLVIVANHPNGLVDPVLIMRDADRPVRFLAKEPLFRMPIVQWFVQGLHALPVYRRTDGHATTKNEDTFRAVHESLAQGDAICIFPEGTSHSESDMLPLKTGAARMALGAEASRDFSLGVRVLPVGLIYRDKGVFRSEALSRVGTEIEVKGFADAYRTDPRAAVEALTEEINRAIRDVTINLERWEDLPLLEVAEKVWRGDGDPLTRIGVLADGQRAFAESQPERLTRLRLQVGHFKARLDRLGLSADDLDARYSLGGVARFVVQNLVALLFGLPMALIGAIAYFVPYQTVRLLVGLARPTPDLTATYKLLGSLMLYPVWHALLVSAFAYRWGPWAAILSSLMLPLAAVYTHQFIEGRTEAIRDARVFLRSMIRGVPRALETERDAIRAELDALERELGAGE